MKLPIQFLKFWYIKSLQVFIRSWYNSITVIEEDLAVGLMWKLLFTPLFHDASFVGRTLSFFFRLFRIGVGVLGFIVVTSVFVGFALFWFLAPIIWIFVPEILRYITFGVLITGFALFMHKILYEPQVSLWHIKDFKLQFRASKLRPKSLNWASLISSLEVKNYLESLELYPTQFGTQEVIINDQILEQAFKMAKAANAKYLTQSYLWVAMLFSLENIEQALLKLDLTPKYLEDALKFLEFKRTNWRRVYIWDEEFATRHLKGVNRGWLSAPTPALDQVSTDLTKIAASKGYPKFIGRQAIVSDVVNILSQTTDRNVLLIGPAGTGKNALVNHLAGLIVSGDAPASLATKRVVELDLAKLLSDVETEGDLAAKIKQVFAEVEFVSDVIIFIDELHNLGTGDAARNYNLFALLSSYLESDKFQFLATTEVENFSKIIEKNSSFARIFHKVELSPATIDETLQIIQWRAIDLMRYQKINLSFVALSELVVDSAKLIHDRVLPDSALFILNEATTQAKDGIVNKALVKSVFSNRVKIPMIDIDDKQKQFLLNLEQEFGRSLIAQTQAVKVVADTLRRSATALRDTNRPIGSFLFVGPTGVGKTELAKTLSRVYFKNEASFIQFDMSEYQTTEAIDRLIGGSENLGELTEAMKNNPYSLLLLDEFEKADHKVLTLFLQILEEGRLTDFSGRHIDFSNSIIIATSNVASLIIAQGIKSNIPFENLKETVKGELLKLFKPELINRFDEIVIFKPLSEIEIEKIVKIKLEDLQKKLKEEGYLVEFDLTLISELAKKGYDPVLGARPLKRYIQDNLEAKLSRLILENKLQKGDILKLGSQILL